MGGGSKEPNSLNFDGDVRSHHANGDASEGYDGLSGYAYYIERIKERMRSLRRIGMHSMSMTDYEKGSRASGISNASGIGPNISR